jgi:uncharacterized protein
MAEQRSGAPSSGLVAFLLLPVLRMIPKRQLGRTGIEVSLLAVGGSHLADAKREKDAVRIVHEAIDRGINFFDNAWEYHQGHAEELMGKALSGKRDGVVLMTKVCTHGRGAEEAMKQLETSLRRLRTDHLDVWQIHEVIYDNDPALVFRDGGAIEALVRAKEQGKVRAIGFTGHKDPKIHLDMLSRGFPFDTCQMPLNCFDGSFHSFEQLVLPELVRQGIAPLGMKSLCGNGSPIKKKVVTAEEALRYVLSLPVASLVSGIDSLDVLHQNLEIAERFRPMSEGERIELRTRVAEAAADGHFELYKTSKFYDGPPGREQHGFPSDDEVAA